MMILKPVIWLVGLMATDIMRQIANAHTFFNLANVAIQLPFAALLIKFVIKVVPGENKHEEFELRYLDREYLRLP
jgi:phosphate:Na+ symporter